MHLFFIKTYPPLTLLDGKLSPSSKKMLHLPVCTLYETYQVPLVGGGACHACFTKKVHILYMSCTIFFFFTEIFHILYIPNIILYISSPQFVIHLAKFIPPLICSNIRKYTINIFNS